MTAFPQGQRQKFKGRWAGIMLLSLCLLTCASAAEKTLEFSNIGELLDHARKTRGDPTERVKVRGTVSYSHRGYSAFIQDQTAAIYVGCTVEQDIALGDEVEVNGRLNRSGFSPIVGSASMKRLGRGTLPAAQSVQLPAVLQGEYDMRLISFVASLGACYDHGTTVSLIVVTNGVPFHVELAKEKDAPNPFASIPLNSTVKLTGICSVKADRDRTIRSIMILIPSPADLTLLSLPPFWTARRIGTITVATVAIAAAALVWVVALRRQVRSKTAEVMRLNQQLEQKVKTRTTELETVNRELQAFTYSVSHDLKAPVRAIQNFSGLLRTEHASGISSMGSKFLERIHHNADNMGKLISSLLSFSNVSQCHLNIESVDMKVLVQNVIDEFSDELQSRTVEFQVGELPHVEADRTLLKQVVTNLIGNAIKYTRVRNPARIEIGCRSDSREIVFFVKDNGIGFAPELAAKLFQPFERLHSTREYEGSGVGLALAQRIIARHNGRIWAETNCENGCTFYWALPKTAPALEHESTSIGA